MAKAAILDVLENTIGKYVQNLDAGEFGLYHFAHLHQYELN